MRGSCRICFGELGLVLSLGQHPVPNHLPTRADEPVSRYPLDLMRCQGCGLFQAGHAVRAETLFRDYAYETPDSPSLTAHYERVYEMFGEVVAYVVTHRPGLVVEVGSNNGAFLGPLSWWGKKIGVDPSAAAERANERGIETRKAYFNRAEAAEIRKEHGPAMLVVMRHCLAHVDDIHELMAGAALLLHTHGVVYVENAYVYSTLLGGQYDQIYHEHMSYLAASPMKELAESHSLELLWVVEAPVHGGSMGFFLGHKGERGVGPSVAEAIRREVELDAAGVVGSFASGAKAAIEELGAMVRSLAAQGKIVDCYGASAKGVTVLNAAGLTHKEIRQCLDGSARKHGRYVPGTGIPIVPKSRWRFQGAPPPHYTLVTAWNYLDEIRKDEADYEARGGKWIVPVPAPRVL
jgi:SAM-dependent methyltransferase